MGKWLLEILDGFATASFRTVFFIIIVLGVSRLFGWNPIDVIAAKSDVFLAALFGAILGGFLAGGNDGS